MSPFVAFVSSLGSRSIFGILDALPTHGSTAWPTVPATSAFRLPKIMLTLLSYKIFGVRTTIGGAFSLLLFFKFFVCLFVCFGSSQKVAKRRRRRRLRFFTDADAERFA